MLGILKDTEIEALLKKCKVGRIGCSDGYKTYVVPVTYVYDGKQIIAHSLEGMKIKMMRENPEVCFEVDEINNDADWKSVIAWGTYHEIKNERERRNAMQFFIEKMMRLKIKSAAHKESVFTTELEPGNKTSVKPVIYRIILGEKTGRFERNT
jgi:nitroimidazol reductase NimA-like FMN-containing flavoprotein (pyridoxamine 5'-phosphate oxidase superfamily)